MAESRKTFLALALLFLLAPIPSGAQVEGGDKLLPFLATLRGDLTTVQYQSGSLDRASHLQHRFELLAHGFSKVAKQRVPIRIFLLDRENWEKLGLGLPYGMAGRLGQQGLVLPASGDDGTVKLWRDNLEGYLPPVEGTPLMGTAAEVASLGVADLVAQVEAARYLMAQAGIGSRTRWVGELMAYGIALEAFHRHERIREVEIAGVFGRFDRLRPAAPRLTLDGYSAGVTLEDWLRFQGRFFDGAWRISQVEKGSPGKALLKLARKSGGNLSREALLAKYPFLTSWLAASFEESGSTP